MATYCTQALQELHYGTATEPNTIMLHDIEKQDLCIEIINLIDALRKFNLQ